MQTINTLDHDTVRAGTADARAHAIETFCEISHLGLESRIVNDRSAIRERRRHHQVFRPSDRDQVHFDAPAP